MSDLTRILLVDSNPKYLKEVLSLYGYNVTSANNASDAIKLLKSDSCFDLMITDMFLSDADGLEILKKVKDNPKCENMGIIILTSVDDDKKIISSLKLGADDYIVKPVVLPVFLARIEAVLRRIVKHKNILSDANVTINQADYFNSLTKREKDVLLLVTRGESNKSVAQKLVLSEITVKSHLNSIFKKLHVANRTQAVLLAMQMNFLKTK